MKLMNTRSTGELSVTPEGSFDDMKSGESKKGSGECSVSSPIPGQFWFVRNASQRMNERRSQRGGWKKNELRGRERSHTSVVTYPNVKFAAALRSIAPSRLLISLNHALNTASTSPLLYSSLLLTSLFFFSSAPSPFKVGNTNLAVPHSTLGMYKNASVNGDAVNWSFFVNVPE